MAVRAVDDWRDREKSPCSDDMVFVPSPVGGFCIDKYENSPGRDCDYPFPMNQHDTALNLNNGKCRPEAGVGRRPWTYVSRDQAQNLCALAGKRLPTAAEWHLAALGTPDDSGQSAVSCLLSGNWPMSPGPAGFGQECVSAVGAYDMIGNVWEWVSDEVGAGQNNGIELPERGYISTMSVSGFPSATGAEPVPEYNGDFFWVKADGIRAVAKGGYYGSAAEGGRFSTYAEAAADFTGPGIGFRCVK